MPYITIRDYGEDSFEEKKSEFIGYAKRVESEEEAKEFVSMVKGKHKQARHNCYAYVIGKNMEIQRYSDDGEPQGTAGIPILEVIKKNNITDCAIVITRYFGGILLGTGGLTRAYKKGASISIKNAGKIEKVQGITIGAEIDYDFLGKIQYLCAQNEWYMDNIKYSESVNFEIIAKKENVDNIEKELINNTSGKIKIVKGNEESYFKENNRLFKEITC